MRGETPEQDARTLSKVMHRVVACEARFKGVSPYKIPLWFNCISYHRPPYAFRNTLMADLTNSYMQLGRVEGTTLKKFVVFLQASAS